MTDRMLSEQLTGSLGMRSVFAQKRNDSIVLVLGDGGKVDLRGNRHGPRIP